MKAEDGPRRARSGWLESVVALIPAYNPDETLLSVVASLLDAGFARVVVVDDGSAPASAPVFARLRAGGRCTLLGHAANLGKGRALKTGLNHILLACPDAAGVVTVDADGQHLPADVAKVAAAFLERPDALVLGSREFGRSVPLRSLLGNVITRGVFRLLVGTRIADTQSGLRCFSLGLARRFLALEGERYEYEMNMLIEAHRVAGVREVGIATVYLADNRSSHFNPLVDSMRIYFLLLRFSFSSVLASLIDFTVFALAHALGADLLRSMIVARAVAGSINFVVNRSIVFHSRGRVLPTVVKYVTLLVLLGGVAYLAIGALARAGTDVILAKFLVETLLFLVSFSVQRGVVFTVRRGEPA